MFHFSKILLLGLLLTLTGCTNPFGANSVINFFSNNIIATVDKPELQVTPMKYNFGNVAEGNSTDAMAFVFINYSSTVLATECSAPVLSNTTDFYIEIDLCEENDLYKMGTCPVGVVAYPQSKGLKTSTLTRTCVTGGEVSTEVAGISVTGIDSEVIWDFSDYDIGNVLVNDSITDIFYMSNYSSTDVSCSEPVLSNPVDFEIITDNCGVYDLLGDDSCSIEIKATPKSPGVKTTTVSRMCGSKGNIISNNIMVTGENAGLNWSTLAYDFRWSGVNQSGNSYYFGLNNSGGMASGCSMPQLSNSTDFRINYDDCSTNDLNNGESCWVEVVATPSTIGPRSTTLSRTCSVGGTASTSTEGLVVIGMGPALRMIPNSHDFGQINVGDFSSEEYFRIRNIVGNATNCSAPQLTNNKDFYISNDTCDTNDLDQGEDCEFYIVANPQSGGVRTTRVTRTCANGQIISLKDGISVTANMSVDWQQQFGLAGFGTALSVGSKSTELTYYYRNTNDTILTGCSQPQLSDQSNFSIVSDACGTHNMNPLSVCEVKVKANSVSIGHYTATLSRQCDNVNLASIDMEFDGVSSSQVIQVVSGLHQNCAIMSDATVKCWGSRSFEQVFLGGSLVSNSPALVSGLTDVSQLTVGYEHSCAMISDGTVKCWGNNSNGQLGNGTNDSSGTPVLVSSLGVVTQVAIGDKHSCALIDDGTVKCWGSNSNGELGDGSYDSSTTPVLVDGISSVIQIASGKRHICALINDGSVYCWGSNQYYQIGFNYTGDYSTPILVNSLNGVVQIALGTEHSCALLNNDTVKCWGRNNTAQLGNGTFTDTDTPTSVSGLNSVSKLSLGNIQSCALLTDGKVKCWGHNMTTAPLTTPTVVSGLSGVNQLSVGMATYALMNDGSVKCWGSIFEMAVFCDGSLAYKNIPSTFNALTDIKEMSLGYVNSCAILNNGTVQCWGLKQTQFFTMGMENAYITQPEVLNGVSSVKQIENDVASGCALISDGTVKCWGDNSAGQLGDGTNTSRLNPEFVTGLGNVKQISVGQFHVCALINNGTVKCWGRNGDGQLGDGTNASRNSPALVSGLSDVVEISLGSNYSCALINDGTAQCWGENGNGQLGNGDNSNSSYPVAVYGISGATKIATSQTHSCVLLPNKKVKCWGTNQMGELGDGTTNSQNTPVYVKGLREVTQIDLGGRSSCAVLNDGQVKCWGWNIFGLGGTGRNSSFNTTPEYVLSLNQKVLKLSVGMIHSCATLQDQSIKCWGFNGMGQFGNNDYYIRTVSGF